MSLNGAHQHADPSPFLVTLGPWPLIHIGPWSLPTYYLVISLSLCLGVWWFYHRSENKELPTEITLNLSLWILISGFIGARLFHVLIEEPSYYWQDTLQVLAIEQGGFVFLGGALLAALTSTLYLKKQERFWDWLDAFAPVGALTYSLGRIGCFLGGCCYGRVCPWPWATPLVEINSSTGLTITQWRHPTALYATFLELIILWYLMTKEKTRLKPGQLFLTAVLLHCLARVVMESFRDDPRGPEFWGLSVSTLLSLMIGLMAAVLGRLRQ